MKKHILIVGGGPRALSASLYSLYKGHTVTLIDPNPLFTWSSLYITPNILMRSPITFDLVTFLPELQEFSLSHFLGIPNHFTTQYEMESNTNFIDRNVFYNYLQSILNYLKDKITIVNKKVIDTTGNKVKLDDDTYIEGDAVIFCIGNKGKENIPNWIYSEQGDKVIDIPTFLSNPQKGKKILVVGSGQRAAEVVDYLVSLDNEVYWSCNKDVKVYQYPIPDTKLWGSKSGLGPYYSLLKTDKERLDYLGRAKQWQPSITPYINNRLTERKYSKVDIKSFKNIPTVNTIIMASGLSPLISSIPTTQDIPHNLYLNNFPVISKNFKLEVPNANWYVSGILAIGYDGPRQNSLISAGLTSKSIINNIGI